MGKVIFSQDIEAKNYP